MNRLILFLFFGFVRAPLQWSNIINPSNLMNPSVEFGELGTFEKDGEMGHIGHLPNSPEEIKTKFLYKSKLSNVTKLNYDNPKTFQEVLSNGTLVVIVHGYQSSAQDSLILRIRNSLLKNSATPGTIIVDWESGASSINYFQTAANAQVVGRQIALLIHRLRKHKNIDSSDVHLVGFSLGAQACGFAARWAKQRFSFTIGRISALDAAWYLFEDYSIHVKQGDASFIDAIHTSAGNSLLRGEYGSQAPFGNVDFYPNGGTTQPHCKNSSFSVCNHLAALIFYETSITYTKSCDYFSVSCASYSDYLKKKCDPNNVSQMGFYANRHIKGKGKQYLRTTEKYPHKPPIATDKLFYKPNEKHEKQRTTTQKAISNRADSDHRSEQSEDNKSSELSEQERSKPKQVKAVIEITESNVEVVEPAEDEATETTTVPSEKDEL